jgi:hypothetical protein
VPSTIYLSSELPSTLSPRLTSPLVHTYTANGGWHDEEKRPEKFRSLPTLIKYLNCHLIVISTELLRLEDDGIGEKNANESACVYVN